MDSQADKPIISNGNVYVRQGQTFKLGDDGAAPQEITCDDVARLALAMHDHSYFFSLRRGLSISYCRDTDGSGRQSLTITEECDKTRPSSLIDVLFEQTYGNEGEFLYEADLFKDGRKDYEPTLNHGKHRFVAQSVALKMVVWNSEEAQQWRLDLERLSRSPDTLAGWIANDSEMLVICRSQHFCRKPAILTINDLKLYDAAGLSLEGLKTRLKCSKCGKREPRVKVF